MKENHTHNRRNTVYHTDICTDSQAPSVQSIISPFGLSRPRRHTSVHSDVMTCEGESQRSQLERTNPSRAAFDLLNIIPTSSLTAPHLPGAEKHSEEPLRSGYHGFYDFFFLSWVVTGYSPAGLTTFRTRELFECRLWFAQLFRGDSFQV